MRTAGSGLPGSAGGRRPAGGRVVPRSWDHLKTSYQSALATTLHRRTSGKECQACRSRCLWRISFHARTAESKWCGECYARYYRGQKTSLRKAEEALLGKRRAKPGSGMREQASRAQSKPAGDSDSVRLLLNHQTGTDSTRNEAQKF